VPTNFSIDGPRPLFMPTHAFAALSRPLWVLCCVAVCAMVAVPTAAQPPAGAPNIIFLLADDLGYGDTGVTGQNARKALNNPSVPYFETPNIDSLATQGARFDGVYSGSTTCAPSRATLMTGMDTGHVMIDRVSGLGNTPLRGGNQDRTWGQVLQDAGYETGFFGKWHISGVPLPGVNDALPTQKGFETAYGGMSGNYRTSVHYQSDGLGGMTAVPVPADPTWTGPGGAFVYSDNLVTNKAEQFIRQKAVAGEPFASYVAFIEPHSNVSMVPQDHPYVNMPWPKGDRDFAGTMSKLDGYVGQLLHALEDPNGDNNTADSVLDNTLIIFTSDNGPVWDEATPGFQYEFFNSNGSYNGHKWQTEEGGVKVPFFARWGAKIAPGTVNNSYVGSFEDILPTFAELAGQQAPLGIDGKSMLSDLVGGPPSDRRDALIWFTERGAFGTPSDPLNFAVRVGDWKLVVRQASTPPTPDVFPIQPLKLFNLAVDPYESNNLVNTRLDIRNALQTIMVAEGGLREPTAPWFTEKPPSNTSQQPETVNTYFAQYKAWAPQGNSTDFYAAGNWSGGTQYWQAGFPEAQNWNTGPADNWLATVNNSTGVAQQLTLNANADLLAIELRGTSQMRLDVNSDAKLSARNGIRISTGGLLRVHGGELNTIRDLEILPGGRLDGEGLVNGQQAVLAGIAEFAGLGLFEPRVVNHGVLSVVSDNDASLDAGKLIVQGDYVEHADGALQLDVFSVGSTAGANFDQLAVTGIVTLNGALQLSVANPAVFSLGDTFQIIAAAGGRRGVFSSFTAPALPGNLTWALQYTSTGVIAGVVTPNTVGGPFDYLAQWRLSFGTNSDADLDGDGDTDGSDLLAWQRGAFYATVPAFSAVPEPASAIGAIILAACALPACQRRRCCSYTTSR
jgi:arylsulfatase A-like enzyme